jgi:hypothetical protein
MEKKDEKAFFCSMDEAIKSDDNELKMYVKKPLFIQLCVQASKCTELPQEPFKELLQRYKIGEIIEKSQNAKDYVVMTRKDGEYRLMSYIEKSQKYPYRSPINSKDVHLEINSFMTEEDKIKTMKVFVAIQQEREAQDSRWVSGPCFMGCVSAETINAYDTSFENDTEHHEAIVQEFNQLLNK